MMTEAEALEEAGYHTDDFLDDAFGHEVHDRDGNPVLVQAVDDDGNPAVDDDGQPKMVPKRRIPLKSIRAGVWLAVRRAGATVAFDAFDFDLIGLQSQATVPGKDPEPDPASPS